MYTNTVLCLYPIQEYIWIQQATIAEQVACRIIYDMCTEAEKRPGMSQIMRWWDQYVVNESEEWKENICNLT